LNSLLVKAQSRGVEAVRNSLSDPEIIKMSKHEYENLAAEIEGDLPPFEEVYGCVREYYESLPW